MLFRLAKICLASAEPPAASKAEVWSTLANLAVLHGVAPLLWLRVKDGPMPEIARQRLSALYRANAMRAELLQREQERIVRALAQKSVSPVPLKGPSLSEHLFGDPAARQTADVDLLIRSGQLAACDTALRSLGYRTAARAKVEDLASLHEVLYLKGETPAAEPGAAAGEFVFAVDVHLSLLPYGLPDPLGERIRRDGLASEHLLHYLCLNAVVHRFARLKFLLDVAMQLRRIPGSPDWGAFVESAGQSAFAPGVLLALRFAFELNDWPSPQSLRDSLAPRPGTRFWTRRTLGNNVNELLQRMEKFDGPRGAPVILLCTRAGKLRRQVFWRMLFPETSYLQQEHAGEPESRPLFLHWHRLRTKLRGLLRPS